MRNTFTKRLIHAALNNRLDDLTIEDLNFINGNLRTSLSYETFDYYPNTVMDIIFRIDKRFKPVKKAQDFLLWYDKRYTRNFIFHSTVVVRARSVQQAEEMAFFRTGIVSQTLIASNECQ